MGSLLLFFVAYLGFVIFPNKKTWIALGGVLLLIACQILTPLMVFQEIHWNVLGLFFGTLILAELFLLSRVPACLAEWLIDRSSTIRMALVNVFLLTSILSMFVENVAVVLLIAPVILSVCDKLYISPVKPVILLAIFSNLQGTATLIGDPPSMILGSYMKMSFKDFFFYQGRLSIFFVVQAGMLSALALSFWLLREHKQAVQMIRVEKVKSWVPTILLALLIVILAFGSSWDRDSVWLAGTTALSLGLFGLIWLSFGPQWLPVRDLLKILDWDTTLFLASLFVLVGAIRIAGWMDFLAQWTVKNVPNELSVIFIFLVAISVIISAFVDNVPYLIAMIPVVQQIADATSFPLPLLVFGLLVGSCLGGNITPIGASANIVAVSLLNKNRYTISFADFTRIGMALTLFAVVPAALVLWLIWS
ncbi:putative arsenical pump membrane protein [Chlamydiales bacterium STE3]|nr:putative arsenical pump membrane protein [Chlamydiales bacterium STE3]